MNDYENFLKDGKIVAFPKKKSRRKPVLEYLASKFEFNRIYTEKEVNEMIDEYHLFNDYFLLRRELIEYRLLFRTNNGAKYWKASQIPNTFETERLILRNTVIEDEDTLFEVSDSCNYMAEYTGETVTKDDIHDMIVNGDLPPKGYKEFFQSMTILSKENNDVIGDLDYYCGYPNPDTLWISSFTIKKDYQEKGYGKEVIDAFSEILKISPVHKIGIGVHLKNWQALRFWFKCGFAKITAIKGDKVYAPNHFSIIALEKTV